MFTHSGSFPSELFLIPKVNSIAAIGNCFSGSLPKTICRATSLQSLALDGLAAGERCTKESFFGVGRVIIPKYMEGSIPNCVWRFPALETLHMAGNGFTGSLPSGTISDKLKNLNVGFNRISGTISNYLLSQRYSVFDVSFNKITGTLMNFDNDTQSRDDATVFRSKVNRLSGDIPLIRFRNFSTLDILNGNIFSCDYIPEEDVHSSKYICGSKNYDAGVL